MQVDTRPRFGWTDDIDLDPTHIFEDRQKIRDTFCVVIALPKNTPKSRRKIQAFCKTLQS